MNDSHRGPWWSSIRSSGALLLIPLTSVALGCSAELPTSSELGTLAAPIVYGTDSRAEYFEASEGARSRLAESAVALVPKLWLDSAAYRLAADAPSSGQRNLLCADEPFSEQPAAAFCSGVLVDWDLVLAAGHCVRVLALDDFAVVFGYYYRAPGELDIGAEDVFDPVEIVSEALDPEGVEARLDFAWLRLSEPVRPPRRPAPIRREALPFEPGDAVTAIGAAGGSPLKVDESGRVLDTREPLLDYFVADTDTSHGSSGGGAFDDALSLVGILARGGPDYVETDAGCATTVRRPDTESGEEQFTYAARALAGLCDEATYPVSICRASCGSPCEALPFADDRTQRGCAFSAAPERSAAERGFGPAFLAAVLLAARARQAATRRFPERCPAGHRRASAPRGSAPDGDSLPRT